MDNWIDELAAKSRQAMSAHNSADERFNIEQRLKDARGLEYWERLQSSLKTFCDEHNGRAGIEILGVAPVGAYEIQVYADFSRDRHKRVPVSYTPSRRVIEWGHREDIQHKELYLLELVGDLRMVGVVSAGHPTKYEPEDIAKRIIQFVADVR